MQKKAQEKIAILNNQITSLTALREAGLSGVTKVQIDNVRKTLDKERMGFNRSIIGRPRIEVDQSDLLSTAYLCLLPWHRRKMSC